MSLNLLREVSSYNYDENTGEEIKTFNSIAHEDDILQFYLKEIGKIKLLKSEEEKQLGKLIKEKKDIMPYYTFLFGVFKFPDGIINTETLYF